MTGVFGRLWGRGILELSIGTLQDITFHYDRMEFMASINDSILTDMADFLVQKDRIPFRSAHNIIASAVRAQGDNPSSKITLKQLNKSSKQHLGHDTTLTESEWASLQSPRSSVANKRSEGSPAQSSCPVIPGFMARRFLWAKLYASYSSTVGGLVPTRLISPFSTL